MALIKYDAIFFPPQYLAYDIMVTFSVEGVYGSEIGIVIIKCPFSRCTFCQQFNLKVIIEQRSDKKFIVVRRMIYCQISQPSRQTCVT